MHCAAWRKQSVLGRFEYVGSFAAVKFVFQSL